MNAASEATGLFVLLFGAPALLLSIVFAAIAWRAPRGGAVLCGMLFVSVVPLLFWAHKGGYLETAGVWLVLSIGISAIGLLVALARTIRPGNRPASKGSEN